MKFIPENAACRLVKLRVFANTAATGLAAKTLNSSNKSRKD